MEKELEKYLGRNYNYLFNIRNNNRLYIEKYSLKMVSFMLSCIDKYSKTGKIDIKEKDYKRVQVIMKKKKDYLINYYLSYPIANIISSYLINNFQNINKENFCKLCLSFDIKKSITKKQLIILKLKKVINCRY